jgi:hypothetical protein
MTVELIRDAFPYVLIRILLKSRVGKPGLSILSEAG